MAPPDVSLTILHIPIPLTNGAENVKFPLYAVPEEFDIYTVLLLVNKAAPEPKPALNCAILGQLPDMEFTFISLKYGAGP